MSNDTREALAAKCKELADKHAKTAISCAMDVTDANLDALAASATAVTSAIDRLAALTEQPAAPAQEPQQPAPTVQVLGVKADGSEHDLGTIPEVFAPKFKMREIVRSYFGHFEEGDDSQADMCMIALEEFQRWYKTGLDAVAKQPAASSPAPAVQERGVQEHFDEVEATLRGAHAVMEAVSAIERRVGPVGSHARGYTHKITNALKHLAALRAAAPQAEPLTDRQIDQINCRMWASCPLDLPQGRMFARAIERAHGIGAAPAAPAQEPQQPDPCPQCRPGVVCRTPKCGRLRAKAAASSPAPAVHPTYTEQQIADACVFAEISDSKCESLLIGLRDAGQPQGGSNG